MTGSPSGSSYASLYVHVPFCTKKCPYCHFFVLPDSDKNKDFFLSYLHKEWWLRAPLLAGKKIVSIYFGGGTPSLLSAQAIEDILRSVAKGPVTILPDCEITLEANPELVSLEKMQDFQKAGINRISLGVQSFDDTLLKKLGRTHDKNQAKLAVENTRSAGIHNISIDLMYELPGQTVRQWENSLNEIPSLPIDHLSLYNLTFEQGTSFYKRKKELSPTLPSQEESLLMLHLAVDRLEAAGLKRYEISAFAKNGLSSVHNTGYWTGRPFLGLGPSAFSYQEGRRFRNIAHLKKYADLIDQRLPPEDFEETLSEEARRKELLAVELRLLEGVDLDAFEAKNGSLHPELTTSLQKLLTKGWLEREGKRIRLTKQGLLFYDSVGVELI